MTRLHTKLFEEAARDLDRQVRARHLGEGMRPAYLNEFRKRLEAAAEHAEAGAETGGRLLFLKKVLRRLLRPYLTHQAEFNKMALGRVSALHEMLTRLEAGLEGLREEVRDDLERQDEALRAEVAKRLVAVAPAAAGPAAVAPAGALAEGSKLVLGPVAVRMPGYVHVTARAGEGGDVCAPYDRLPVAPGTAAEVVAANVLEGYTEAEVAGRLIPYWASLLKPGHRLTLVADDLGAAADRFREGRIDLAAFTGLVLGDGALARRSAYTPDSLRAHLTAAGLTDVSVTDRRQRPGSGAFGFEVVATRAAV